MTTALSAIVLFEDEAVDGLSPLTLTRPAFELRCGALNLRERLELAAPGARVRARVRPALEPLLAVSLPELTGPGVGQERGVLLVNARLLATVDELRQLVAEPTTPPRTVHVGDAIAVAWVERDPFAGKPAPAAMESLAALPHAGSSVRLQLARHLWELIAVNGRYLCEDFRVLHGAQGVSRRIFGVELEASAAAHALLAEDRYGALEQAILYPGVHLLEERNVAIGPGAKIKPGVVLDAEDGPILIGAGALLNPNVVVQGPAYIGAATVVNAGARLREGTSVGAVCKLGGEIEESVVLDFSNKQHDGFLGHAYVGSWVNLGAATDASDLKNNYGNVRVDFGEGEHDTGLRFVGPMIGDHAKTAIHTMLTTGTVVGVCANVFGAGFPPRFIPSFAWGGAEGFREHRLEAACATAKTAMGRRRAAWRPEHAQLLTLVQRATATQR